MVFVLVVAVLGGTASAVNMQWVTVGDPGNAADMRYNLYQRPEGFGRVDYTYQIGKYEVTNSQYAEFLNAVDPNGVNPYGLHNTNMGSGYGGIGFNSGANPGSKYTSRSGRGNMPVNWVSFWDACRFANWMHNGQGTGSTETGAYSLNGVTNPPNDSIVRSPSARVFIPSEDEWYKAAYYKGGSTNAGYWDYPTQSDMVPRAEGPPGTDPINGSANHFGAVGDLTNVGSYTAKPSDSAYRTFDQGGNVWEWNDTVLSTGEPFGSGRCLRGGSFYDYGLAAYGLRAAFRSMYDFTDPSYERFDIGFRVAPEPATLSLLALGGLAVMRRRRAWPAIAPLRSLTTRHGREWFTPGNRARRRQVMYTTATCSGVLVLAFARSAVAGLLAPIVLPPIEVHYDAYVEANFAGEPLVWASTHDDGAFAKNRSCYADVGFTPPVDDLDGGHG